MHHGRQNHTMDCGLAMSQSSKVGQVQVVQCRGLHHTHSQFWKLGGSRCSGSLWAALRSVLAYRSASTILLHQNAFRTSVGSTLGTRGRVCIQLLCRICWMANAHGGATHVCSRQTLGLLRVQANATHANVNANACEGDACEGTACKGMPEANSISIVHICDSEAHS